MKKWHLFVVFAAMALSAVGYMTLPRYTIAKLELAARDGNVEQLQRHIDFPALRDNFKLRLQYRMSEALGEDAPEEMREFLAAGSNLLFGPLLEQLITPENIGDLLKGGRTLYQFERELYRQTSPPAQSIQTQGNTRWRLWAWRFTGANRVTADYGDERAAQLRLTLERHRLSWRLVDLELL